MIENEPEKQCFTHNNITKYLKDSREVPMALRQVAKTVFETLDTMIMDNVFVFHEEHKLAPIEFVFFCLIIAKYPSLELWQYQMYLKGMKQHVKSYHDDIRFNNKVYATLKAYVENMEPDELASEYRRIDKRKRCSNNNNNSSANNKFVSNPTNSKSSADSINSITSNSSDNTSTSIKSSTTTSSSPLTSTTLAPSSSTNATSMVTTVDKNNLNSNEHSNNNSNYDDDDDDDVQQLPRGEPSTKRIKIEENHGNNDSNNDNNGNNGDSNNDNNNNMMDICQFYDNSNIDINNINDINDSNNMNNMDININANGKNNIINDDDNLIIVDNIINISDGIMGMIGSGDNGNSGGGCV